MLGVIQVQVLQVTSSAPSVSALQLQPTALPVKYVIVEGNYSSSLKLI